MPQETGPSRAERAARTRQALIDAALRLFAERGYDATTTEEIAEAAGVSPRTFFRYFPTKESVLLRGESDFVRSFTGVYLAQPETMTELEAMRASFVILAPGLHRLRGEVKLYRKAVASSLTLRGRESANHAENAEALAEAIARRRGAAVPDAGCDLLAALGLTVLDHALTRWLRGPAHIPFGQVIDGSFAVLQDLARPSS
ncbi:TetR/AcrR family transcriptional regulator [Actinocorallia populi]|uniref:TetR/AcrR family transcriptional regulator n=1 Tax=Actinocorallia populi TaxID=2079200 RepID=UPI000D097ED8|nr:TetR/AcrR family transcriptional regulator [Actinocorallia populi]